MPLIHKKEIDILSSIPDFSLWEEAFKWMQKGRQEISRITHEWAIDAEFVPLEWSQIQQTLKSPFGHYFSEHWRKFVLAAFFADLASYEKPVDQVTFDRLLFVMHAFPEGFRVWWVKLERAWWPIGYSGWYPMFETMFEIMKKTPEKLRSRMVIPNPLMLGTKKNLYLFNFSVIAPFKKTELSRALIKNYCVDICERNPDGMACITVSEDGIRIAERLGLSCSGHFQLDGCQEKVYINASC